MHVGNQRCSEIRGFSTTAQYVGSAGMLAGGDNVWICSALVRVINYNLSAIQVLVDSTDVGGSGGFSFYRDTDSVVNIALDARFGCTVYGAGGGGDVTVSVALPMPQVLGKLLLLSCAYNPDANAIAMYVNGAVSGFTVNAPLVPGTSGVAPRIGAQVDGTLPSTNTSILAVAYADNLDAAAVLDLAPIFVQSLKTADIGDGATLTWKNRYSARALAGFAGANGAGYPRTLANLGNGSAAQVFTKTGNAALTVGNPQVVWSDPYPETEWALPGPG